MPHRSTPVLAFFIIGSWCALSAQGDSATRVSVSDRMWIASKIYASIQSYFGHWQGVPGFDLDATHKRYVAKVAATDDRLAFDLATVEFIAELRNGHSTFDDAWLWKQYGQPLGFELEPAGEKWVVRRSRLKELDLGETVLRIDGKPIDDFLREKMKLVAASGDRARRTNVFYWNFLWPQNFTLTLDGNREVRISRLEPHWKTEAPPPPRPGVGDGVIYHRIPSFEDPKHETAAIDAVKANPNARAVIFDVRGNGGGSSPERLLRAIMERPYRDWTQATSMTFGLFYTYGGFFRTMPAKDMDPRERGYYEGFSEYFERPYFMTPGAVKPPEQPLYRGRIVVLTDRACASACEDFVMPLKTTGRATLIGETTFGSSGQPFLYDFGNGMSFRVSTKRMYLPDGSEFEGVGIRADIEVAPTIDDVRSRRDVVLLKAIELIGSAR
jgi:carboxyl-terminal processing protease